MRTLLAAALLLGVTACTPADEKKPDAPADPPDPPTRADRKPKLAVGDPAPPLAASHWLKGAEVKGFEAGKVYVVDFWATWCGPCIASMPHLSELAAEYADQGLVAVAFTTKDPNNSLAAVKKFVADRGDKFAFGIAFADAQDTYKAYMEAAGQNGIPCSFVVDKAGKVAFIGHPMELDDVLPKVVAGTWRGQADLDEIKKVGEKLEAIYEKAESDAPAALAELAAFEKAYPDRAAKPEFAVEKVLMLLKAKQFDDAKAATEAVLPALVAKKKKPSLFRVRGIWASPNVNPDRKHIALAVKAAEEYLALEGDKNPLALVGLADAQFAAGNSAKAVELTEKALTLADDDQSKEFLKKQIAKYKGEKPDGDKK